jgi:hypothetical protein
MDEREELKEFTDGQLMEWAEKRLGWTTRQLRTHLTSSPEWGFNLPDSSHDALLKFVGDIESEEFVKVFLQVTHMTSDEFRTAFIDFVLEIAIQQEKEARDVPDTELIFYSFLEGRGKANAALLKDALRYSNISFNEEMGSDLDGKPEIRIYVDKASAGKARTLMHYAFTRRDTFQNWSSILAITTAICFVARWVFPEGDLVFKALGTWSLLVTGIVYFASVTLGRTGKDLPRVDD